MMVRDGWVVVMMMVVMMMMTRTYAELLRITRPPNRSINIHSQFFSPPPALLGTFRSFFFTYAKVRGQEKEGQKESRVTTCTKSLL